MAIENTYLTGNAIQLGSSGFDLAAPAPLDTRATVPVYAGLAALKNGGAVYEGMRVYVETGDEKGNYQYINGEWKSETKDIIDLVNATATAAMEFKGVTATLPENPSKGDMYKVAGENISIKVDDVDAKFGDSIVYNGEKWFLIPSGDDIEDTWRPVTDVDNDASLTFAAGDKLDVAVAANGTVTYSHEAIDAPELLAENEQTRTYITAVETDGYGHITGYKTATENVEDTNTTYEFEGMPVGEGEEAPSSVYFQVKSSDEDAAEVIYLDAYNKNEVDGKFVADADLGAKVDALVSECKGATGNQAYADLSALVLQTWSNTEDISIIKNEESGILAQAKAYADGLVTNDLTDELKEQYDAAYAHSQVDHAPADAQANIIESVKVNGTALEIKDKAVDITVPTGDLAGKDKVAKTDLAEALATEIDNKVASVTAGDASVTVGGTATNPTVAVKISEVEGNALTLEEDGLKVIIPESTKVEASETNGNIKVDGQEVTVYAHPESHTASEISDFATEVAKVKVNEATKADAAAKVDNALTVKVGGEDVVFDGSAAKTADIDAAIKAAKTEASNQDAVVLAEAQKGIKDLADGAVATNAGNIATLFEMFQWGEF